MKIELNIRDSHVLILLLLITAASAMGLVVAYNSGLPPSTMGHTWGEMECSGCITTSNLADSSVTTAKLADNSVTGAKIGCDGTVCKDSAGNVGIGTSSPGTKLDVTGQVRATDVCTTGGMCLSTVSSSLVPSGISITHVTGSNPACSEGAIIVKKWSAKTCSDSIYCPSYGGCTTGSGWSTGTFTCTYTAWAQQCMYNDYTGQTECWYACVAGAGTCVASAYTEAVCMGN
jgi:hypothetical protein